MSDYEQVLLLAIDQARGCGKRVSPEQLIRHVAELCNPFAAINDFDTMNRLFAIFREEFEPILHLQNVGTFTAEAEIEQLVGLLRWLRIELGQFDAQEPSEQQVVTYLVITAFLDHRRTLWCELPLRKSRCKGLFEVLTRVIKKAKTNVIASRSPIPVWEQEAVDAFQAADADGDFVKIDELWPSFRTAFQPNLLLRQAVLCLAFHDFPRLIEATNSVKQTAVAMWIADALPSALRFRLSLESTSRWIIFVSLYFTMRDQRRPHGGFRPTAEHLLVSMLMRMAKDDRVWMQTMTVYNSYPLRYPALQRALGITLARMSPSSCEEYANAIKTDTANSRREVAVCLRTFQTWAWIEQRRTLLGRCYQRWGELMNTKPSYDHHHFDVFFTNLDYAVVAYLREFVGPEKILAEIEKILMEIVKLTSSWYANESDCHTTFYILLSRLQPYFQAIQANVSGKDLMVNTVRKIRIPRELERDRYTGLMFDCSWTRERR